MSIEIDIMKLHGQGFCCTQIFLILCLELMQEENPALVRAAAGFCKGGGDCDGQCGILSGGIMATGLYAAKGTEDQEEHDKFPLLLDEFKNWFIDKTSKEYCGISCGEILGAGCNSPVPAHCGKLLAESFEAFVNILTENGFDPSSADEL